MIGEDVLESLDGLLDLLAIQAPTEESERDRFYADLAFQRAERLLRAPEDDRQRKRFEVRLRLSLHLAPKEAIAYRGTNPIPRWRLIRDHLVSEFRRTPAGSEPLARAVAMVLDNWDRSRAQVTSHRELLLRQDGPFCSHCRVRFNDLTVATVMGRDPYKPFYLSPEELLSPEVDHVEAISAMGTNIVSNLQLLCRLCNGGKGDGLGLDVRQEARYAGVAIDDAPVTHRCALVYYVILRDGGRCSQCSSITTELTIRPIVVNGALSRSNLRSVCLACLGVAGSRDHLSDEGGPAA